MLDIDKQALLSALRAVERLHFQNLALETLLEFYKVPNWKAQTEKLASDRAIQPGLRAEFQTLYAKLEHDPDLSAIEAFLLLFPTSGEPN